MSFINSLSLFRLCINMFVHVCLSLSLLVCLSLSFLPSVCIFVLVPVCLPFSPLLHTLKCLTLFLCVCVFVFLLLSVCVWMSEYLTQSMWRPVLSLSSFFWVVSNRSGDRVEWTCYQVNPSIWKNEVSLKTFCCWKKNLLIWRLVISSIWRFANWHWIVLYEGQGGNYNREWEIA